MNILGIDCSTKWTNIGITSAGIMIGDINMLIGRGQSSQLPALVTQILSSSGVALDSLDAVSVTSGPGYFSGIRVGLSYGCALAEGIGRKVVVLDSLSALAAPFLNGERTLLPVIRARKGFVYSSVIKGSIGNILCLTPPALFPISELGKPDRAGPGTLMVLDDDSDLLADVSGLRNSNIAVSSIRGGYVSLLGCAMFEEAVSPSCASAQYLRDPEIGKKKYGE